MDVVVTENLCKTKIIGAKLRLTLADAKSFASNSISIELSDESYIAIERSYQFLKNCVEQRIPIYGINTNFGDQVSFLDPHLKDDNAKLYYSSISERQENLIKSHTCALGNVVKPEIIKIAMMLRLHCLAQGYSGINPITIKAILAYLNAGIIPSVRHYGSIGASGDLIPMATIAAGMLGENIDVLYCGEIMQAHQALKLAGLKKLNLGLRDGLAMINGTSFMTASASLALYNLKRLFTQMLSAIAMSLESMLVISSAYHPLVHQLKQQTGECIVNEFLLNFWEGSQLLTDLDELRTSTTATQPIQDYYSLRAVSQGFGSFQENLEKATIWIENEMNSVNDNPIIDTVEKKIHHSANFMGYYVTDACDTLKMNIAQASTWLHALLANMVHPRKNHNLPANLAFNPSKYNGFRPIQLLAAALAVQNRKLAQSHQAFHLPTEGDNQDVSSLGTHAAFDLQESVANLERLTAILFLASAQALEFRDIKTASKKAQIIHQTIRQYSPAYVECRPMTDEINIIIEMLNKEKI